MWEFKPLYPDLLEKFGGDLRKYHEYLKQLSYDLIGKDNEKSLEVIIEAGRCLIRLESTPVTYICRTCLIGCVYTDPVSKYTDPVSKGCVPDYCPIDGGKCEWVVEEPGDMGVSPIIVGS